jgi:hypothetical protein
MELNGVFDTLGACRNWAPRATEVIRRMPIIMVIMMKTPSFI